MSNLKTIVLIFAVCMLANFLHYLIFGIDEEIASGPPDPVDIGVGSEGIQIQASKTTNPPEYSEDDLFEDNSIPMEEDDFYFDEVVEPENYHHRQGKIIR